LVFESSVLVNKCTKYQFIHLLTATFKDLNIENKKNHKRWYCPHHTDCVWCFGAQRYWGHDLDLLESRDVIKQLDDVTTKSKNKKVILFNSTLTVRRCDVIDHVTIGLGVGTFLLVVNDDHASILQGYRDTGLQKFWGHEFDLLGSRDVIGYVTIGLGICSFLLVVHWNHASILHSYGDIKPQSCICPC